MRIVNKHRSKNIKVKTHKKHGLEGYIQRLFAKCYWTSLLLETIVTQHGKGILPGKIVICSKSNIKGMTDRNI